MLKGLSRRDSLVWIISDHLRNQIKTCSVQIRQMFCQISRIPFWESWLKVRETCHSRPVSFLWSPKNPENLEDLINFRISCEKRFSMCHFRKYASNRPNVNRNTVLSLSKKDFRSSIPQCDNLVELWMFSIKLPHVYMFLKADRKVLLTRNQQSWGHLQNSTKDFEASNLYG